jgi:DnaJ-class molecular chaperone
MVYIMTKTTCSHCHGRGKISGLGCIYKECNVCDGKGSVPLTSDVITEVKVDAESPSQTEEETEETNANEQIRAPRQMGRPRNSDYEDAA